jgi:long-chain acyl-CoA synthetase
VTLFVVPTLPEIAAAYGITDERCGPAANALQWDDLATCFPSVAGAPDGEISSMIYTSATIGNPKGGRRLDIGDATTQLRTFVMDKVFGIATDRVARAVIAGPLYDCAGFRSSGRGVWRNALRPHRNSTRGAG